MPRGPLLRLVLPHQLFEQQLDETGDTVFVLIEHDLLFRQYAFHSHKLVLHRASMARFAARLRDEGFGVHVLASDSTHSSHDQLVALVRDLAPSRITWFDVVDDWLERDLRAGLAAAGYTVTDDDVLETPNFLTDRDQIDEWFAENRSRMQDFYVWQRRRLDILIDRGKPVGGQWSYDADNRKKLPRDYVPSVVGRFAKHPVMQKEATLDLESLSSENRKGTDTTTDATGDTSGEVAAAIAWVRAEFPDAPGDPGLFAWPTTHDEARTHLDEFVRDRLADFGPYEDAMSAEHPFVNHALLTPPLNVGLLDPEEVVRVVLDGADAHTPLASLEGFVRQVIGWREYMRATYRTRGVQMRTSNQLEHLNALGEGWWDATTGLLPVDTVLSRVLATGYAHHIERLMVLGNVMCLLRIHPDDVYEWFMSMFVDAYDWVMVPNVYAMSQFAATDEITTKPYVSGSNYVRKMSDFPRGEWMPNWDGLYWTFVDDHRAVFAANPRSRMIVSLIDKMDDTTLAEHRRRAQVLLGDGSDSNRLLLGPAT